MSDIFATFSHRQEKLLMTKNFICQCGRCMDTSPAATMESIISNDGSTDQEMIDSKLNTLNKLLESTDDLVKLGDNEGAVRLLTKFTTLAYGFLHHDHALWLAALVPLMNAHLRLRNLKGAYDAALQSYNIMERTGPCNWPEKLELYLQIGNLLQAMGDTEGDNWICKAKEMSVVLFGADHRKTTSIIR
jgi:hypothetical protein